MFGAVYPWQWLWTGSDGLYSQIRRLVGFEVGGFTGVFSLGVSHSPHSTVVFLKYLLVLCQCSLAYIC